jgi:hypothetical protein
MSTIIIQDSSPLVSSVNPIVQNVEMHLNSIKLLKIDLCLNNEDYGLSNFTYGTIKEKLEGMTSYVLEDVCSEMKISSNFREIKFNMDQLCTVTESDYQSKYLGPLANENHVLDTHASNKDAKFLCVSPASASSEIDFLSRPDAIHPHCPMIIEVKSRFKGRKNSDDTNMNTNSLTISDAACSLVDTISPLIVETSRENNGKNNGDANMDALGNPIKSLSLDNITLVEIDLFQQCLERIVEQSQFRAYLSKIIVLGSTGHTSWCFYYTQQFDSDNYFKKLKIMKVSCNDIDVIWNGVCDAIKNRDDYYLTSHAKLILHTIPLLNPVVDVHSVRVHVAGVSRSTVYYITFPSQISRKVNTKIKDYAFKVMLNDAEFKKEVNVLKRIKNHWDFPESFYYIHDSDSLSSFAQVSPIVKKYCWLKNISSCNDTNSRIAVNAGGVIIMLPASRNRLDTTVDTTGKIFSELLKSLSFAHSAGFLHCDLRPSNCLLFGEEWQVIDYDLAIQISNNVTKSGLITQFPKQRAHGYRISEVINDKVTKFENQVEWTINDDIEMLHIACMKVFKKA